MELEDSSDCEVFDHKHEGLISISRTHANNTDMVAHVHNPNTGEVKQVDDWYPAVSQSRQMSKSQSSEKSCLKIIDGLPWAITPKIDLWTPPVHTHIFTFIHINTHKEVLHNIARQSN